MTKLSTMVKGVARLGEEENKIGHGCEEEEELNNFKESTGVRSILESITAMKGEERGRDQSLERDHGRDKWIFIHRGHYGRSEMTGCPSP